ncbi:MAG: sulfite exporter TauE/SafE family protein [Oscillospiraceae bacterium]|jgi:sulfite exporter TauE/SafE/copper chaperone CopZ|nr:sulfite exporter TauE/SafE family protein [Oscillospiraceae bacterium]
MAQERAKIHVLGMHCAGCEGRIERKLPKMPGVSAAFASMADNAVRVTFDPDIADIPAISAAIESLDYQVTASTQTAGFAKTGGLLLLIAALYFVLEHFGVLRRLVPSQLAESNMQLGMLFVIGLLTSVHCVCMCGGLQLSGMRVQESARARFGGLLPTILYNAGRVVSYTAVGALVGALGSAVTFSAGVQGGIKLLAGVWMVFMGLNSLGLFPFLAKLTPRLPKPLARRLEKIQANNNRPLFIGLLGGLMPCGPLQAMQLYALSTGSALTGALSMFLFALGTVPLMFGLGALAGRLGKKFPAKAMAVGAILVAVLGLSMFTQGWSLAGLPAVQFPTVQTKQSPEARVEIIDGVQVVHSTLAAGAYPNIRVQANLPVRWIIDAPQGSVNGCNYQFTIPKLNITYTLETGENVLEFPAQAPGKLPYNCWMGMIRGEIVVG